MSWLSQLFGQKKQIATTSASRRETRPGLERLEARDVPTVTFHGGALLPHVEVQALYYGNEWTNNQTYYQQSLYVDGFLHFVVNSPYMDMLSNAGYGVGRGSETTGRYYPVSLSSSQYLTDGTIRSQLQAHINSGGVAEPDANRFYVIVVEPNIAVQASFNSTIHSGKANSQQDFYGYHGAFAGHDSHGHAMDIHYALIAYPGGAAHNATLPPLNGPQQVTEVTSHELAEGVTDPNVNYKTLGWYDNQRGEIGDIVNAQYITYHGYIVQKEANQSDHAIVPPDYHGSGPNAPGDDNPPPSDGNPQPVDVGIDDGQPDVVDIDPGSAADASRLLHR